MTTWLDVTIDDGEFIHRFETKAPDWPGVPRVGDRINTGDRDQEGISMDVERVRWYGNGDVSVSFGMIDHVSLAEALTHEGWKLRDESRRKLQRE